MLYAEQTASEDTIKRALAKIDEQIAFEQQMGDSENEGYARWQKMVALKNFSMTKQEIDEATIQMEWFSQHSQWNNFYRTWQIKANALSALGKLQLALQETQQMLNDAKRSVIKESQNNPVELMTWLYAHQGEMRFGAENRLFVILADSTDMSQSWKMKRAFSLIEPKVQSYLDIFTNQSLKKIDFAFKKQNYSSLADVIFVVK
jgi:hypothetical protein